MRDQPCDARHETNAICNDMMSHPSDIIIHTKHGTALLIDFSERVFFFPPSPLFSRTFSFDTCLSFCLFSERISFVNHRPLPSARPGLFFYTGFTSISGRHCMSGIFQRSDTERQE